MKCGYFGFKLFLPLFIVLLFVSGTLLVSYAEESGTPETLEVSEPTSTEVIIDDQNGEEYSVEDDGNWWDDLSADDIPEEYEDALETPYDWPEWLDEEQEDLGLIVSEYESVGEVTLVEINETLNSILFCIILFMSCGVVALVCKMVYPLFRGGR